MSELFDKFNVPDSELALKEMLFKINVKGSNDSWNKITNIFRTEKVDVCRVYFKNNATVKCSTHHRFYTNTGWKMAKDLTSADKVKTEFSWTGIKNIKFHNKEEILYDISVENTHEYLSNGVLSHNSWLLASLGANAVKQGLNVVHYSLELSESYVGKRYDCILSGISLDKIDNYQSKVEDVLKKITGNLTIKWYPTKSISLIGIRSHISKLQALNLKPDLIIIDYADLLKFGNSTQAKHEALESLYEELRGLAGELQIPLYTASQANRESTTSDVIEADKMAGAYAKIFPADFVISISRKPQDKISNTARVHVIKNRFGIDGITFPVYMDTSRGIINIHDEDSGSGRELTKTMQTDSEYEKKRLKQRVTQLSGKNSFLKDDKLKLF